MTSEELIDELTFLVEIHGNLEIFYVCSGKPGRDGIDGIFYDQNHDCYVIT